MTIVMRRRRKVTCHVRWRWSVIATRSVSGMGIAHWVAVAWVSRMLVVRTVVRVRWWGVHRAGRCPGAWVRGVAVARSAIHRRLVNSVSVARRSHWSTSDGRNGALLVNSRFRVHALLRTDVAKLRVVGGLHEVL